MSPIEISLSITFPHLIFLISSSNLDSILFKSLKLGLILVIVGVTAGFQITNALMQHYVPPLPTSAFYQAPLALPIY